MALFKGWNQGIGRRVYHWMAELTFGSQEGYKITFEKAVEKVIEFFRDIQTSEHIQIASFFTTCRNHGRVHIHALLIGRGRGGKTLLDVNISRWVQKWPHRARIQQVHSQVPAIMYVALQFIKNHACDMHWYNQNLLRKSLIEENPDPESVMGSAEWLALHECRDD